MNRRYLFLLSLLLTAAVLALIFGFSAQPAPQSDGLSTRLAEWLSRLAPWLAAKTDVRGLNRLLRKLAHFTLYFLLGCGLTGMLRAQERVAAAPAAVALGVLFAALDEWHQAFVPGRGPGWGDVLLDSCGVAAAVGCIALASRLKNKKTGE